MSNFNSETVTWTAADGVPAVNSGYSGSSSVVFWPPRQLKKSATRTYNLSDGSTKVLNKVLYKDLPPRNP
jgi:hypothetical protein